MGLQLIDREGERGERADRFRERKREVIFGGRIYGFVGFVFIALDDFLTKLDLD